MRTDSDCAVSNQIRVPELRNERLLRLPAVTVRRKCQTTRDKPSAALTLITDLGGNAQNRSATADQGLSGFWSERMTGLTSHSQSLHSRVGARFRRVCRALLWFASVTGASIADKRYRLVVSS